MDNDDTVSKDSASTGDTSQDTASKGAEPTVAEQIASGTVSLAISSLILENSLR